MAGDAADMKVGAVTMSFLVGTNRHFRHMCVHRAIREDEHHVRPTSATRFPFLQLKGLQIGNEIGFPHMTTGTLRNERAFTGIVIRSAFPCREAERVFKDKFIVMEHVHDHRHVVSR